MIKNFIRFIKENIEQSNDQINLDEAVIFHLDSNFIKILNDFKGVKLAELYIKLLNGVQRKYLVKEPVDYLNIDKEGNVSFLRHRYFNEEDKWGTTRRQKMKMIKVIKDIYNESYLNIELKQTDIESFSNRLTAYLKPAEILELRGNDLLRAYNYTHELIKTFGNSCANFYQKELNGNYREPWLDEYYVYTKNPENCGVIVVIDNGKIVARRSFQQGIQLCDAGTWKKGEHHTVWGNYYGVGGNGSKYDTMIIEYLKNKYNAASKQSSIGSLCISMETRWKNYPAFDSMFVCFEHNLLSDNYNRLSSPYNSYRWINTYPGMDHLHCPTKFIDERLKEESTKIDSGNIIMNVIDPETTQK